jgi:CheY-like chemotaxis protein/anti-sigma regulatory factor (Ser/Thr protein kinase)
MLGDPTRVRQIALNLVGNAVKFTERGEVRCSLSLEGQRLKLEVRDTGVGMSAEALARIGAPFVQADASTTRRHGGTGLGLVITRRLISAMGGELRITSTPGVGSAFTVLLPAVVCDAPLAHLNKARHATGLTVLVVDDNAVNQLVAQRLLERLGHQVQLATDGAQAVERACQRRFDVIFMDCHMPVMDGIEATRRIRADERGRRTPIVALTADALSRDRERCLAAGMDDFLTKPVGSQQLAATVERWTGRRLRRRAA